MVAEYAESVYFVTVKKGVVGNGEGPTNSKNNLTLWTFLGGNTLYDRMHKDGWCPSDVCRLRESLSLSGVYYASLMLPVGFHRDRKVCKKTTLDQKPINIFRIIMKNIFQSLRIISAPTLIAKLMNLMTTPMEQSMSTKIAIAIMLTRVQMSSVKCLIQAQCPSSIFKQ